VVGCPLYASIIDGKQRSATVFVRHKDGHRKPIFVNIFPMRNDEGKIIGGIEVFTPASPIVYDDVLVESLSNMAMRDKLTGLPNRTKLESFLEFNLSELKRFQSNFCVVFLDIDNFGKFNNTYGHELGDEVLKTVAKSSNHSVRKSDLFGRWGGEEFIGIFKIKSDFEAVILAEKVRMLIENSKVAHEGGELSVTASIGVTVAKASDTPESVVKRADELMYKSKQSGKNRVNSDVEA